MPTAKVLRKHKNSIFMALGLVLFIVYLAFFVGIGSLFDLISKLNLQEYSLYYSIAICALFLSVFFDSLIWHSLLQGLKVKMKLRKVLLYNWIGNFVEMVIPCETVCGEVTRIYLARKETNENVGISAAPVITSRMLSTFVYTGGLLVGSLTSRSDEARSLKLFDKNAFKNVGYKLNRSRKRKSIGLHLTIAHHLAGRRHSIMQILEHANALRQYENNISPQFLSPANKKGESEVSARVCVNYRFLSTITATTTATTTATIMAIAA